MAVLRKITVQFRETDTHTSQVLTLEGTTFRLETYTNAESGIWCADIFASDGTALVQGLGLVVGVDLLEPYRYLDGLPPGYLFVYDQSGLGADPGLTSFYDGDSVLYYLESE